MKFKAREGKAEELQLNMTAMIDIVFQLLVFFIMTFKVTAMEADFNIRMPSVSEQTPEPDENFPTIIEVSLKANSDRNLNRIEVNNGGPSTNFTGTDMYRQLTGFVEKTINQESDPSSQDEIEVEFDIDESLRYRFTVQGIEAVFGRIENGEVFKLVEKIKFKPKAKPK